MFIQRNELIEVEPHRFVLEASQLNDRCLTANGVGTLPRAFEVPGLGNGQPFLLAARHRDADGDIQYWMYRQVNGCVSIKILND